MKVITKLAVGFLIVVLLIWATVFISVNTYTVIHQEFELLEEDIVPGAEMQDREKTKERSVSC